VICLEPFDPRELRARRWDVPGEVRSMSRSPEEWLRVHSEIVAAARDALSDPKPRAATGDSAVTVCMPYFNHAKYVADALAGMAQQTSRRFTVIVIDDGSTSADSRRAFEHMRERYGERGWKFLTQPRGGAGTARNFAAREAASEYVLFFDTDDIPPPNLVERMLEAAEYSGDDLLTVWHYKFRDVDAPYDFTERRMLEPAHLFYTPPGNDPVGNLAHNLLGGGVFLARRSVFLAVGGFPEQWGGSEDYALHMRFTQGGYATDVVPEYLCYNRDTPGSITKTLSRFSNHEIVRQAVDRRLHSIGLSQFALTFRALAESGEAPDRD
jgi:glycosyltransferase involved in cell wall biosynthesis